MRGLIRYVIRRFISKTAGKLRYQRFYTLLNDISLRGMNYYNSGYFKDSGELKVVEMIAGKKNGSSNKIVVFDVGANIGDYSYELSNHFNRESTIIYAFEPSVSTFNQLEKSTQNVVNIKRSNFGFGDTEEEIILYSDNDQAKSGLASVYPRNLQDYGMTLDNKEKIYVTTIDQFCASEGIHSIDFLKIDVEGHELKVLKGASQMIQNKKIDYIQFEFGEAAIDSKIYLRDFYEILNGYEFYRIVKDGIYPLGNYKEEYEILRTINFLAVRKG